MQDVNRLLLMCSLGKSKKIGNQISEPNGPPLVNIRIFSKKSRSEGFKTEIVLAKVLVDYEVGWTSV